MGLNTKQARFTYKIAQLIVWANEELGVELIGKELLRSKEQAEINAAKGVGIKNSVHRKGLALDMYVFKNGKLLWSGEDYKLIADKWKTMDPDARWGGNFRRRDVYHYSFMHNGTM